MTFQIRDADFGLALYEGASAVEALLDFVADRAKGKLRPDVVVRDDGTAEIVYDGVRYQAVHVPDSGGPTAIEIAEAEKRLAVPPWLSASDDRRRLRIANGTASVEDRCQVAAENEVERRNTEPSS